MTDIKHCQQCNAPRRGETCHKCGTILRIPHPAWEWPKLPDVDQIRKLAKEVGYAIAVHGTLERDLDLVAAPWVADAVSNRELIEHLAKGLDAVVIDIEEKPLGRLAAIIQLNGWYKPIDLSVCPIAQ